MDRYERAPIDTPVVKLSDDPLELTEKLAANAHDNWATLRIKEGWSWGRQRDRREQETP